MSATGSSLWDVGRARAGGCTNQGDVVEGESDLALALDKGHPLAAADVGPHLAPADVHAQLRRRPFEDDPVDDALDHVVVAGQLALVEDGHVLGPHVGEDRIADRERLVRPAVQGHAPGVHGEQGLAALALLGGDHPGRLLFAPMNSATKRVWGWR